MPDWNLDLPFDAEPTRVPTSNECEKYERGVCCGRTDCYGCGKEAAYRLRYVARSGFPGLALLAREVARVQEAHGVNVPDDAVVIGDVAYVLMVWREWNPAPHTLLHSTCIAWAEGLVDATCDAPMPRTARECFTTDYERWCYFLGRVAPALYRLHADLRTRDAQCMAAFAGRAFGAMADADITSAAVAQQAEPPTPSWPRVSGSGFESRAQHEQSSAEREQARRRVRG